MTKNNCYKYRSSWFAEIMFGFNPTYSVSEDVGSVHVSVSLLSGILARDVIIFLRTMNGTAVGESYACRLNNGACVQTARIKI